MGSQLSVTGNMAGVSEAARTNPGKQSTKIDIFANDSTPIIAHERKISHQNHYTAGVNPTNANRANRYHESPGMGVQASGI